MKRYLLLLAITISLLVSSCKESTVDPDESSKTTVEARTKLLISGYWITVGSTDPGNFGAGQLQFFSDGSALGKSFNDGEYKEGSWHLNAKGDSICFLSDDAPVMFYIENLDQNSFILSGRDNNDYVSWRFTKLDNDYRFALGGKIINSGGLALNKNMKVVVAWAYGSGIDDSLYVYGKGTINIANNTFYVGVGNSLPNIVPVLDPLTGSSVGEGYILLVNSDVAEGDYSSVLGNISSLQSKIIGAVDNKGIIILSGITSSINELDWRYHLGNGWYFGKGVSDESRPGFETWEEIYPMDVLLRVDSKSNLRFPHWK